MALFHSLIGAAVVAIVGLSQCISCQEDSLPTTTVVTTQTCTLEPSPELPEFADINSMIVHSQDFLDHISGECTEIVGGLAIASDFNGTFSLPNITRFTGEGIWQLSPSTPGLTGFDCPDMVILSRISLDGVPALTSISMPRLEQIETFVLLGNSAVDIELGSLVNASNITIEAVAPVLNLTSLQQVNERLSIQNVAIHEDDAPPSSFNFGSLTNATSISIAGNITELNMPFLETALSTSSDIYESYGIAIESSDNPLIVNLPSLYNASGIKLDGSFAALSFPMLHTLNGVFDFTSSIPFLINFTTINSVVAISLSGKITSFSMPSLKNIQSYVTIISSEDLDCSIAAKQYTTVSTDSFTSPPGGTTVFSCRSTAKQPLSTGAKVGLAFGTLAVVGVLLGTTIWAMKRYWRRKGSKNVAEERAVSCELGDIYKSPTEVVSSERPPPYAASVHSDIGPLAEPKSTF